MLHFWRRKRDMASVRSLGGVWHALVQSARYSHAIRQIPPKAVCEPCGFGRSSHDIKTNTIRKGWCPFLWRRKRDSILARTTRSVFLGRGRPPEVRSVPIPLRIPLYKKRNLNQTTRVRLRLLLAQEEGFEPPWLWA